jgi:hypothetical protein
MILYVNGDSHTAAAEAVNPHAFAEDDGNLIHLGRLPHPNNLAVSWGKKLSTLLKMAFYCDAESASSNDRIIRTTKKYINNYTPDVNNLFVIIGWSTWEREEWLINDVYYQINASGTDIVPESHKEKYKEYVLNVNWRHKTNQAYKDIVALHEWLGEKDIKHIFFNGNNTFNQIRTTYDFGNSYIEPYDKNLNYNDYLIREGIHTVTPNSYHFGEDGHTLWAKYMLKYIVKNNLI